MEKVASQGKLDFPLANLLHKMSQDFIDDRIAHETGVINDIKKMGLHVMKVIRANLKYSWQLSYS